MTTTRVADKKTDRLRAFRLSLDPQGGEEITVTGLDKVIGKANRWRLHEKSADDEDREERIAFDVRLICSKLDVTPAQREAAVAYVLGRANALPWKRAAWLSPQVAPPKRGRKKGVKVSGGKMWESEEELAAFANDALGLARGALARFKDGAADAEATLRQICRCLHRADFWELLGYA